MLYPLTHPQKRIWYIEKMHPDTSVNNIGGTVRIKGKIHPELMGKAINAFIAGNDAIRLHLIDSDGEVKQYIDAYRFVNTELFDFSGYPEPETAFISWVDGQARTPFKLEDSDLFYFALFRIHENDCGYLVKLHHILCDGWSVQLMTGQICQAYDNLLNGMAISNDKKPSYIQYIKKEQEYLQSEKFIRNKEYWLNKFKILPDELSISTGENITSDNLFRGTTLGRLHRRAASFSLRPARSIPQKRIGSNISGAPKQFRKYCRE